MLTTPPREEFELKELKDPTNEELSDDADASQVTVSAEEKPRIWPATYVCSVVASGFLLLGFSMGFNSPVLSSLKSMTGYTSLQTTLDQDLFNVCCNCMDTCGRGLLEKNNTSQGLEINGMLQYNLPNDYTQ